MRKNSYSQSNDNQITMVDKNGNEQLFNILLTFKSDDYGKSYILLYPVSQSDDKEVNVQAYALSENDDPTNPKGGRLIEINDDDEWDMVESVLNTFMHSSH